MPRVAKSTPSPSGRITRGDEAEIRVAQTWFWEGNFARRGINLKRHYQAEAMQVTDLDLLAIELGPALQARRFIGESKTGMSSSAPRPLDRVIWLRGLMDLMGDVVGAELTSARRPPASLADLAAPLAVVFQSLEDLERREGRLRMDRLADRGSQGPGAFLATARTQATVKSEPDLDRAFWFVRSDVWFLDPWMAMKRLIAVIETMSRRWTPRLVDDEQAAVRWILAESVAVFALQVCIAGAPSLRLSPPEYGVLVANRLADPGIDPRRMHQLSDAIDRYVGGLLAKLEAPRALVVESMGAFVPTPPPYAEALAETARRIASRVDVARVLPRYVDLMIHERLVRNREPDSGLIFELDGAHPTLLGRAARLLAAFLSGQAGLPRAVAESLGEALSRPTPGLMRPAGIRGATAMIEGPASSTSPAQPDQDRGLAVQAPASDGPPISTEDPGPSLELPSTTGRTARTPDGGLWQFAGNPDQADRARDNNEPGAPTEDGVDAPDHR